MTLYQANRFATKIGNKTDMSVADVLTGHDPAIIYFKEGHKTIVGAFNCGSRQGDYSNLSQLCFSSPKMIVNNSNAPFAKDARGQIVGYDITNKLSQIEASPDTKFFYSKKPVDWMAHQMEQAGYQRHF